MLYTKDVAACTRREPAGLRIRHRVSRGSRTEIHIKNGESGRFASQSKFSAQDRRDRGDEAEQPGAAHLQGPHGRAGLSALDRQLHGADHAHSPQRRQLRQLHDTGGDEAPQDRHAHGAGCHRLQDPLHEVQARAVHRQHEARHRQPGGGGQDVRPGDEEELLPLHLLHDGNAAVRRRHPAPKILRLFRKKPCKNRRL